MIGNPKYPNLELIEYKFKQYLYTDDEWKEKVKKLKEGSKFPRFLQLDFDVNVFSQTWGSTNTAFDICKDGSPAIGGSAMTKAYTVVIREDLTETYGVFVDEKLCYVVSNATEEFYKDLSERSMESLSTARKKILIVPALK